MSALEIASMPRPTLSESLENKISSLITQMATANATMSSVVTEVQKLSSVIYGNDAKGGLVTDNNVTRQALEKHDDMLTRLEASCEKVSLFIEAQAEVNKSQAKSTQNLNRVMLGLASVVFVILILIVAADIHALELLLKSLGI